MYSHYAKFEYKGMKTVGVTYYTNQTPLRIWDGKCLCSIPVKNKKIFYQVCINIGGAHHQCVDNYYESLKIKE